MLDPLSVSLPLSEQSDKLILPKRKMLRRIEGTDDYIWEVDYSTISQYMECPRKGENFVVRGREAAKTQVAMSFGSLYHKLEELRMRKGLTDESKAEQNALIQDHFVYHPVPVDEYRTANRMSDVITKYNEIYKSDEWPQKVIYVDGQPFVERPFKIELVTIRVKDTIPYNPIDLVYDSDATQAIEFYVNDIHVVYVGKIDCGLQDATGIWCVDNKTTSRGGKEFEEAFRLSLQTRGYVWAMKKILNQQIMGLILNAIVVRPLTKTGTGTTFTRHTYFYSEDSINEWWMNTQQICSDFIHHLESGYFPQHARSFNSPCAHCDYNENCPLPRSQRAADLASNLYRDVTWNPMYE